MLVYKVLRGISLSNYFKFTSILRDEKKNIALTPAGVFLFCQNLPEDDLSCSRYNDRVMIINIWQIRTERKMSLVKLSQLTGISKSALSNYENGYRYPNIEQLERIAVALNTSISSLYESPYK